MKKIRNQNRGFSLIELLIAMAIMSIVMLMVSQFMGTTSATLRKTKKNLGIQTEALEVGNQISDILVQATYLRVETQDGYAYSLNTQLSSGPSPRRNRSVGSGTSVGKDLVVDNFPNFVKVGGAERKIIYRTSDSRLISSSGDPYPVSGDSETTSVVSFRALTKGRTSGDPLYVKPKYIYLQYMRKISGTETPAYAILLFEGTEIYLDRGDLTAASGDGFAEAKTAVDAKTSVLTKNAADSYFSADPEHESIFVNIRFMNAQFAQYDYIYEETINLLNSNVLTVEPQKMFINKH